MTQAVDQFARLFSGRKIAYGQGKGGVVRLHDTDTAERAQIWPGLYAAHLDGQSPIGVFPIREDNTVLFAAIDLDEPDFELARAFQSLLPGRSWLERSRSGNAHVWVFFDRSCDAWVARGVLKSATEALGRPDVEIFPKQDRLPATLPGDQPPVGNYINLPYFGDTRPMIQLPESDGATGYDVPLEGFLAGAMGALNDPDDWTRRARQLGVVPPSEREDSAEWGEQPVLHCCAIKILQEKDTNPIAEGGRSVVVFNVAKQLLNYRDLEEQEAFDLLSELNDTALPPLPERELRRIFRSAIRGRYTSTGCDDPLFLPYADPACPIAFPQT